MTMGIIGALMQVLIGIIGTSVTTLAVKYKFSKSCENQSEESDCMELATKNTEHYIANLQIAKTLITLPCIIGFGIALNFIDPFKFLAVTCFCMIIAGSVMTSQATDAGNDLFTASYLVAECFDSANYIITRTIVMNRMPRESRGTIMMV